MSLVGKITSPVSDVVTNVLQNTQEPRRHLETSRLLERGLDWRCRFGCYASHSGVVAKPRVYIK